MQHSSIIDDAAQATRLAIERGHAGKYNIMDDDSAMAVCTLLMSWATMAASDAAGA
jgi:hypothetical protein